MTSRLFTPIALAAGLLAAAGAGAQTSTPQVGGTGIGYGTPYDTTRSNATVPSYSGNDSGFSLIPYTRRGYAGISLGKPKFDAPCGLGGYPCDDPSVGGRIFTGGLMTDWLGLEFGYMNSGRAERAGGRTRAQGLDVNVLLRAPLGRFNVFAKGGAMYAQTDVSTGLLSTVEAGRRRAWAPTYGGGVGFDFTPSQGIVLEWNRTELRFPGSGDERQDLDTTSLGYIYRF